MVGRWMVGIDVRRIAIDRGNTCGFLEALGDSTHVRDVFVA